MRDLLECAWPAVLRTAADPLEALTWRAAMAVSTHPEQTPVLHYYLPAGLRFATPTGPVPDPGVFDWRDVVETAVSPKDILATAFHLLGIDPDTTVPDRSGRPIPVAQSGLPIHEILT